MGNNLVVATAFIDFRKAFDWVSHCTLLLKLKIKFEFFRFLYPIVKVAFITAKIIASLEKITS